MDEQQDLRVRLLSPTKVSAILDEAYNYSCDGRVKLTKDGKPIPKRNYKIEPAREISTAAWVAAELVRAVKTERTGLTLRRLRRQLEKYATLEDAVQESDKAQLCALCSNDDSRVKAQLEFVLNLRPRPVIQGPSLRNFSRSEEKALIGAIAQRSQSYLDSELSTLWDDLLRVCQVSLTDRQEWQKRFLQDKNHFLHPSILKSLGKREIFSKTPLPKLKPFLAACEGMLEVHKNRYLERGEHAFANQADQVRKGFITFETRYLPQQKAAKSNDGMQF